MAITNSRVYMYSVRFTFFIKPPPPLLSPSFLFLRGTLSVSYSLMAEEFQESKVIFVHNCHKTTTYDEEEEEEDANQYFNAFTRHKNNKKSKKSSSEPVNIPDMALRYAYRDEIDDGELLVPPHVIVGRRIARKMAFSVCTGSGRTLKGRDLSRVRNSILRMTGFLEPEAA